MKIFIVILIIFVVWLTYGKIKSKKIGLKNILILNYLDENNNIKQVYFSEYENYLEIDNLNLKIPFKKIQSIEVITEEEIIKKKKNMLGRAVVGGLLFGGVGAIIGGMSALNNDEDKIKHNYLIELKYDNDKYLYFVTKSKNKIKEIEKIKKDIFD